MATIKDHVFAKLVVKSRFATKAQVMECMEARNMMADGGEPSAALKLWDVMIRKGYLTQEQLGSILEGFREKSKRLFGEIAVKWNMVSGPQLDECIEIQNSMRDKGKKAPRIGQILVSKNYLKKHQVMAILEEQKKKIAKCPTCKAQFNLSRVQKGQKFKCTQCGKVLKIFDDKENSPEELDAHGTMVKEPEPSYKKEKKTSVSDVGGYKILQKIGEDSTGLIYKAKDKDGKLVALKVLSQDAAEDRKFVKELKSSVARVKPLDHPSIKKTYEMGESAGTYFVASEFVEGESLRSILNRDGKIGVRKSLKIAAQVAEALHYAHTQGVIHGDIRPSNILVSAKGDVVLSGMGLETKITDNILSIVDSGHLAPFYIAPETVLDDRETDFRADIYSLGATLYHIIAGRPPFEGQSPFEVLMRFTEDYLPPIHIYNPETPPGVARTIEKMVAAEPDERYRSYDELLEHLKDPTLALGSGGPSAGTPPPLKDDTRLEGLARPSGGLTERPGLLLLGIGLVILFAALVGVAVMSSGGGGPETDLEDFKKYLLEHSSRIEDLDEVKKRGDELVTKYPKNKDLRRQVDEKLGEVKQKREALIRLETEEVAEKVKDLVAHAEYGKAFEATQQALGRHEAPDWKEAIASIRKGIEATARTLFDQETQRALAPVRDTPPDRLTHEIFDKAISELEQVLPAFEDYPELLDEGTTLLDQTRKSREETMTRLDGERAAASTELMRRALDEAGTLAQSCRYADGALKIQEALALKNHAGLPAVLPAERPALEAAQRRYDRMKAFLARLHDALLAAISNKRSLLVHPDGSGRAVLRYPERGRLEYQGPSGTQVIGWENLPRADLLALAAESFDGVADKAAPNAEIGTFGFDVASTILDPAAADPVRGLGLHFVARARSFDPATPLPDAYPAVESEWLDRFDRAFEPARLAAEEGRPAEAVLPALAVAGAHFPNFRVWEARHQVLDAVVLQGLQSTFGSRPATTVLAFEDSADFGGWSPRAAPVAVSGCPDGGIARVVPHGGADLDRTFGAPFDRVVFLYRTRPGTGTIRLNFCDAAGKKVPFSIEPARLALNYQTSFSFTSEKPAPKAGEWHVLEFWREGESVRIRIDLGALEMTSPLDSRGTMQPFVHIDIDVNPASGKEDDAAGAIEIDLLMLR